MFTEEFFSYPSVNAAMAALLDHSSEQSWRSHGNRPLNVHGFLYNDKIYSAFTILPRLHFLNIMFVTLKLTKLFTSDVYQMECYFDAWQKPARLEKTQLL